MKVKDRSVNRRISGRKNRLSGKVKRKISKPPKQSKQTKRSTKVRTRSRIRKLREIDHRGDPSVSQSQSDIEIQDCVALTLTRKMKNRLKLSFNQHRRLIEREKDLEDVSKCALLMRSRRRSTNISNQEQENGEESEVILRNSESDCVLIEDTQEIIEIDDDGENDKNLIKDNQVNKLEEPALETINNDPITDLKYLSVSSLESGELESSVDSETDLVENEKNPKKGGGNEIKTEDGQEETIGDDNNSSLSMFYEDITASLIMEDEVPLYKIDSDEADSKQNESTDDVVFVSATTQKKGSKRKKNRLKNKQLDNSVIFVSEELLPPIHYVNRKNLEYIPLEKSNNNEKDVEPPAKLRRKADGFFEKITQPFKKLKENLGLGFLLDTATPSPKFSQSDISFTTSERKRNAIYNTNTYNPNKEVKRAGKRMIIIDGSNVAFAHSCNKAFSVKGIEIALQYFEKMGHEVKAVVPQDRLKRVRSTDPELIESLHRAGKIVLTPCKNLPGKSSSCYDDRFILQLAVEFDAAVLSNDNYRDLLTENPAFKKVIETRVIGYTWCKDMIMLPKDPYGRNGPTLSVIMNRKN